jgi:hypothetical protein
MSRPLRLEFEGALYHITARGDRHEPIFEDDADRDILIHILGQGMDRLDASVQVRGSQSGSRWPGFAASALSIK